MIGQIVFQVDVSMIGHTGWIAPKSYVDWLEEKLKEEGKSSHIPGNKEVVALTAPQSVEGG